MFNYNGILQWISYFDLNAAETNLFVYFDGLRYDTTYTKALAYTKSGLTTHVAIIDLTTKSIG